VPRVRSRLAHDTGPVYKSASGYTVKRCSGCRRATRDTKEVIHNGLLLLRIRYGIPYSDLPDCEPTNLGRFLSFLLLQGKERTSVAFPRRQVRGKNGLCNLQRLGRRDRWALAHSCSSIKRNLPSGCARHTPSVRSQWEANVLSKPPPTSTEYLAFVRSQVTRLFPPGWDKHYGSFVWNHLPNTTARACKGVASELWLKRRSEFVTSCMTESEDSRVFMARYKEVQSAGKKRPLLIYDESIELLAPLHKLLYKKLCEKDWLLCGPPTDELMSSVCVREYQTSVDLVAATDGLSQDISREILDALFFTSVKIPRSLRSLAHRSLDPIFRDSGGVFRRVRHGQMMGAYLSFPLLCLHSYLAALWALRGEEGRILVNGDDCVISADRVITVQDYPPGYRLNDDKTIRSRGVVEVNSTAFLKERGRWRVVRHLRRGGATVDYQGMQHMAKAVTVSPGFVDAFQRARIGRRWGFLPSQLGHRTYPSYRREMGLKKGSKRVATELPEPVVNPILGIMAFSGTPSPVEAEALRSFFWEYGGRGLKRDVWSPSCGAIRRTYRYRESLCWRYPSFVGWGGRSHASSVKRLDTYFLPEEFVSEEEEAGLAELDLWRLAIDSLACK